MIPEKFDHERNEVRSNDAGLIFRYGEAGEPIVSTTVAHMVAVGRHVEITGAFEREFGTLRPGVAIILSLAIDCAIVRISDLKSATSTAAQHCSDETTEYLEYPRGGGWQDRRKLSDTAKHAMQRNGDCVVTRRDWSQAQSWLIEHSSNHRADVLTGFLDDASNWWQRRLSGPVFAHITFSQPLQPLPRAALARLATKLPQVPGKVGDGIPDFDRVRFQLQTSRVRTNSIGTVREFMQTVRDVARAKCSRPTARELLISKIDQLLTVAVSE